MIASLAHSIFCRRVVGKSNGKNSDNEDSKKTGTQRLLTLCRLALIAALVLGIIGATSINGDMSQSDINSLDTYRKANAGLVIGAMIVAGGVAAVMIHRQLVSTAAFIIMVQTVLIVSHPGTRQNSFYSLERSE